MRNADAAVLSKRISNHSSTDYISLSPFVSPFIAPSCTDTTFFLSLQLTQVKSLLFLCFLFSRTLIRMVMYIIKKKVIDGYVSLS